MIVEGVEIENLVRIDDTLMLKQSQLADFARKCIEHGKVISEAERIENETFIRGKKLSAYLRVDYTTLLRWRKIGHPKYGRLDFVDSPTKVQMTLKNARQLRNKILKID